QTGISRAPCKPRLTPCPILKYPGACASARLTTLSSPAGPLGVGLSPTGTARRCRRAREKGVWIFRCAWDWRWGQRSSSSFPVICIGLESYGPAELTFLRYAVASLLLIRSPSGVGQECQR